MRNLKEIKGKHAEDAREFVLSLDEVLNIHVNSFDLVSVSGYKNGTILYREFAPWN
jgi:hypothetical protein